MDASETLCNKVSPAEHSDTGSPSTATNKRSCSNIEEDFDYPAKLSWLDRRCTEDNQPSSCENRYNCPSASCAIHPSDTDDKLSDHESKQGCSPIITIISLSEADLQFDNHKATHNEGRRGYGSRYGTMFLGDNSNDGGRNLDPEFTAIRPPNADNRNTNTHRMAGHESRYNYSLHAFNPHGTYRTNLHHRVIANNDNRHCYGPRHSMAHRGTNNGYKNNHKMANNGGWGGRSYGSGNLMIRPPGADNRHPNWYGAANRGGRRNYGQGHSMLHSLGTNMSTGNRMLINNEGRRDFSSRYPMTHPSANDGETNSYAMAQHEDSRSNDQGSLTDHPPDIKNTVAGHESEQGCSPIITFISLSEADKRFKNHKATSYGGRGGYCPGLYMGDSNSSVSDNDGSDSHDGNHHHESGDCTALPPVQLDRPTLEVEIDKKLLSLKHIIGTGGPIFANRRYLTFFQSD